MPFRSARNRDPVRDLIENVSELKMLTEPGVDLRKICFEKALSLDPENPKAWCNLGFHLWPTADRDEIVTQINGQTYNAQNCFVEALQRRSNSPVIWNNLALTTGAKKWFADGDRKFWVPGDNDDRFEFNGQSFGAKDCLKKAMALKEDVPLFEANYAAVLANESEKGSPERREAKHYVKRAVEKNPYDIVAWNNLAFLDGDDGPLTRAACSVNVLELDGLLSDDPELPGMPQITRLPAWILAGHWSNLGTVLSQQPPGATITIDRRSYTSNERGPGRSYTLNDCYLKASELDPDSQTAALNNRGIFLAGSILENDFWGNPAEKAVITSTPLGKEKNPKKPDPNRQAKIRQPLTEEDADWWYTLASLVPYGYEPVPQDLSKDDVERTLERDEQHPTAWRTLADHGGGIVSGRPFGVDQCLDMHQEARKNNIVKALQKDDKHPIAWRLLAERGGGRVGDTDYNVDACLDKHRQVQLDHVANAFDEEKEHSNMYCLLPEHGDDEISDELCDADPEKLVSILENNDKDPSAWRLLAERGGGRVRGTDYNKEACMKNHKQALKLMFLRRCLEIDRSHPDAWRLFKDIGGGEIGGERYSPDKCEQERGRSLDKYMSKVVDDHEARKILIVQTLTNDDQHPTAWRLLAEIEGGRVNGIDYDVDTCLEKHRQVQRRSPHQASTPQLAERPIRYRQSLSEHARRCLDTVPRHPTASRVLRILAGRDVKNHAQVRDPAPQDVRSPVFWFNLGEKGGGDACDDRWTPQECYVKCLELDPNHRMAWRMLGRECGGRVGRHNYSPEECEEKANGVDVHPLDPPQAGARTPEDVRSGTGNRRRTDTRARARTQTRTDFRLSQSPTYWFDFGERGATINIGDRTFTPKECYIECLKLREDHRLAWEKLGRLGGGQVHETYYSQQACFMRHFEITGIIVVIEQPPIKSVEQPPRPQHPQPPRQNLDPQGWLRLAHPNGGQFDGRNYTRKECLQNGLEALAMPLPEGTCSQDQYESLRRQLWLQLGLESFPIRVGGKELSKKDCLLQGLSRSERDANEWLGLQSMERIQVGNKNLLEMLAHASANYGTTNMMAHTEYNAVMISFPECKEAVLGAYLTAADNFRVAYEAGVFRALDDPICRMLWCHDDLQEDVQRLDQRYLETVIMAVWIMLQILREG